MKSLKLKICLIVALALTAIVTLGIFLGNIAFADRYFTMSGISIFVTNGDAEVWAHRVFVGEGEEDTDKEFDADDTDYEYYTMFAFKNDSDTVEYRRNLAYHWYFNANDVDDYIEKPYEGENGNWWVRDIDTGIKYDKDAECEVNKDGFWVIGETVTEIEGYLLPEMGEGYLNMVIGFEEVNFKKFVITFETQQFNMTKDEKTTNYVIFVPAVDDNGNAKVYAVITSDKDVAEGEVEDIDITGLTQLDIDNIVIQLAACEHETEGEYDVTVSTGEAVQEGKFENVGKTYAKYVSSSTKPVTPLSFKAEFDEDKDNETARMAIYELNGQSFEVTSTSSRKISQSGSHYTGGQINDNQPPVLCLDSGISFIKESSELSFSYTAIDVLTQSPTTKTYYFMLTKEQYNSEINANDVHADKLFRKVDSADDIYMYPHASHYAPQDSDYASTSAFGEDLEPVAALKIYLTLTDTTSTGGQSTMILLDWFVEEQFKLHIGKTEDSTYDYIAVATDETGATFNYGEGNYSFSEENEIWKAYNEKVQEAAKNLRAGSKEDFYLPSVESLVGDNATAYRDMTFGIYYMVNGSTSSNTGRSSSQLYIDLTTDGDYIFTIYANDSSSNKMWYWDEVKAEKVEFTANDIWTMYEDKDEEGLKERLPWFSFNAGISEISVEDPGEQNTAYVGVTYTVSSFDVEGISTKTSYSLYLFNQEAYAADNNGQVLTYQEFMDKKAELFEQHRGYFTYIKPQSELDENDKDDAKFYDYAWNPSSRTFVPQDANAFYLVKCEVTSTRLGGSVKEFMGIASSARPDAIKGEDTWVQDNVVSIILLSIAALAFIGIILLIFIKPKDKGDIDVQYEQEVAKKNK